MSKTYQIAENRKQAKRQVEDGWGYNSMKDAKEALADPKMDNFYRNRLTIYQVTVKEPTND